jgi:regulator of replication initiation timing
MGIEMLRLVKNNASMKRQMQGMEDTTLNLKLENRTLKENYEKLQKELNKARKDNYGHGEFNDEVQRLRKRIASLQ